MRGLLAGKRFAELIALVSVSTTVFLFIHTQILTARIDEIQSGLLRDFGPNDLDSVAEIRHRRRKSRDDSNVDRLGDDGDEDADGGSRRRTTVKALSFTLPNRIYNATELNNTRNAEKETLFFNRVPKVGSQTVMDLIRRLSERNKFTFHKDGTQKTETVKLTYYEEARLTTMIDMFTPPSAYVKHTCFSNFTRHGYGMPIYVNLVRDPIERVISWFYYIRAPWYIIERKQAFPELPLPHPKWLKKDFESCVLDGDRECTFIPGEFHDGVGDHRRQAMFFCGHHEKCVEFDGQWAIEEAKRNVERHYSVVGVLEEFELTLKVLEAYVPRFFEGSAAIYKVNQNSMSKINRNMYKPPVSEKVKDILRRNFTNEIDFYNFCKQRLHMQYAAFKQNKDAREIYSRVQQSAAYYKGQIRMYDLVKLEVGVVVVVGTKNVIVEV